METPTVKTKIEIETVSEGNYLVRVIEGAGESSHRVALNRDYLRKLGGDKAKPEELLRRSFEFLLEREPKESILARFELPVIARYFPEYESEIARRL